VYADPPYAHEPPTALFADLRQRGALAPDAVIVYEHRSRTAFAAQGMHTERTARYGEVALEFMAFDA
jgi:16S rRNA G966 N2-methylase RsmD